MPTFDLSEMLERNYRLACRLTDLYMQRELTEWWDFPSRWLIEQQIAETERQLGLGLRLV